MSYFSSKQHGPAMWFEIRYNTEGKMLNYAHNIQTQEITRNSCYMTSNYNDERSYDQEVKETFITTINIFTPNQKLT